MDRWQQAQDIFDQALQRPPEQRDALLAEACRDDPKLRAEVESLLRHHDQSGDDFMRPPQPPPTLPPFAASPQPGAAVLQDPQPGATVPHRPDPLIGQQIGAYRIERVLGVGGIGTVYLAEQQQPRRLVALKLLRAGIASSSALLRFEYEAEILARLRHPNIAEVYAAGTAEVTVAQRPSAVSSASSAEGGWTTTVPYFAMEYIPEARPITVCADQEGLDARGRLRLFEQVCEAVHHGHQRGVIHRDLKPANILVDAAGRVKVIDFGVARATDADIALTTLRTETGQLIGTLQYMSPEQCHADPHEIDTRSDVYSLGVVLYELLCGRLPYDVTRTPIPTAARIICEQPPPRPSSVTGKKSQCGTGFSQCGTGFQPVSDRRCGTAASAVVPPVKGDLERIILTALEKDRSRRYQSAADLLRDIRHYLNREPIEARPPTPWTRALRWVGRHPAWATTVTCLTIATLVFAATCGLVWWYNMEPYRIVLLDKAGQPAVGAGVEARLLARSSSVLHYWETEVGGISFAKLFDSPEEFGGGKLALIGFASAHENPFPNLLCAYDPAVSLEEPIWRGELDGDQPLPDPHGDAYGPHEFDVPRVFVADVFSAPDHPGDELIVVHGHNTYSQRVIRIYNLRGDVLYQVWHDGSIADAFWLAEARRLVCVGDNGEKRWDERGYGNVGATHPKVVFAIQPEPGIVLYDYVKTQPGTGALDPVWYWCLLPAELLGSETRWVALRLDSPRKSPPGTAVVLNVICFDTDGSERGGLSWEIDRFGREVPDSRVVVDGYKGNRSEFRAGDPRRLPDPNEVRMVPWPPPVPATRGSADRVPATQPAPRAP